MLPLLPKFERLAGRPISSVRRYNNALLIDRAHAIEHKNTIESLYPNPWLPDE
jgi:hypothetical protein